MDGRLRRVLNLVMGGGGVKGIAYIGMFNAAEKMGYYFESIAGVSAGALAGALAGSGYRSYEMWDAMQKFDFGGIQLDNIEKRVPVVALFREFVRDSRFDDNSFAIDEFLISKLSQDAGGDFAFEEDVPADRGNILKNILTFSKEGSLFDGDYLEEWTAGLLAKKGIRTFGDLKHGRFGDFRLKMTGVDLNRAKLVVMPDDMVFYGIDPDSFEIAKAVRISTCVPFAFKPVQIEKRTGNKVKKYNLVDGGVFDRFPFWLADKSNRTIMGFKLSGGEKKKLLSIDTALDILKGIISAVQDIGVPKHLDDSKVKYIGEIDTTKVSYLDFNITPDDKKYLFSAGKQTAIKLFNKYEYEQGFYNRRRMFFVPYFWGRRYY